MAVPFSWYENLRNKTCFNLSNDYNSAEVGFLVIASANRIADALSPFREINKELIFRNIISTQFLFNFGDLTAPLVSFSRGDIDRHRVITNFASINFEAPEEIIVGFDVELNSIEEIILTIAYCSVIFRLYSNYPEKFYDLHLKFSLDYAYVFSDVIQKLSLEEQNAIALLDEVASLYAVLKDVVDKIEEENISPTNDSN